MAPENSDWVFFLILLVNCGLLGFYFQQVGQDAVIPLF